MLTLNQTKEIFENHYKKRIIFYNDSDIAKWQEYKRIHSYEVLEVGLEIIKNTPELLNLSPEKLETGKCALLFHDIGRFYEYDNNHTLRRDIKHGALGTQVLENLEKITDLNILLPVKYHDLIDFSELYQNTEYLKLGKKEQQENLLLLKLVKDADMLSNYRTQTKTGFFTIKQPNILKINPILIQNIKDEQVASYTHIQSVLDLGLCITCWQFNLNFNYTKSRMLEEKINYQSLKTLRNIVTTAKKELLEKGIDKKQIEKDEQKVSEQITQIENILKEQSAL